MDLDDCWQALGVATKYPNGGHRACAAAQAGDGREDVASLVKGSGRLQLLGLLGSLVPKVDGATNSELSKLAATDISPTIVVLQEETLK